MSYSELFDTMLSVKSAFHLLIAISLLSLIVRILFMNIKVLLCSWKEILVRI